MNWDRHIKEPKLCYYPCHHFKAFLAFDLGVCIIIPGSPWCNFEAVRYIQLILVASIACFNPLPTLRNDQSNFPFSPNPTNSDLHKEHAYICVKLPGQ